MAFTEDLDVFINDDTPGYKQLEIDYQTVSGIFDKEFQESGFVESSNPVFVVKSADVPDISQEMLVKDGVIQYRIIGIEDDGTGITKIELRMQYDS